MSGKAARRGRFFGRRRPKAIQVEIPEEQRIIDPARSREDWERWLWQIEGIYGPLDSGNQNDIQVMTTQTSTFTIRADTAALLETIHY
jgi:hypothetical protein